MSESLPVGWAETTLGEIVASPRPKASPSSHPELPFVGMDQIAANGMQLLGTSKFGEMKSNGGLFFDGDVLYGRMRPYLNKVHRAKFDGACSAEFIVMPGSDALYGDFLAYLLHHRRFVNFASSQSSGDRPRVDFGEISGYEFELPPANEQRRIVSKVDELFNRIDEGEQALKRVAKLVDRYRQSVLKAAVTGELTRGWREARRRAGEPVESGAALLARILKARRAAWEQTELAKLKLKVKGKTPTDGRWKQKYKEPAPPDTTDLPELPEGWVWATLECVSECLDYARVPVSATERASRVGDIPYFGANGQVGTINDYLFDEPLVLVVEDETFTGRTRPFSYKIEGKAWVNNHAHVLRPTCAVDVDFLNVLLMRYPFIPLTTGTTARRKLTQKALMSAPVAIPPDVEQLQILELTQRALGGVDQLISEVTGAPEHATALRQSILKAAFSGQLVPQDPHDEPASKLLERIAAERAAAPTPKRTRKVKEAMP